MLVEKKWSQQKHYIKGRESEGKETRYFIVLVAPHYKTDRSSSGHNDWMGKRKEQSCPNENRKSMYKNTSRKEWLDSINYVIIIRIFWSSLFAISTLNAACWRDVTSLRLDRERGADRNQSRGIQSIHAKKVNSPFYYQINTPSNGPLTQFNIDF